MNSKNNCLKKFDEPGSFNLYNQSRLGNDKCEINISTIQTHLMSSSIFTSTVFTGE